LDRPQRLARKQENLTAEKHGGQVTPGSGSGQTVKNDVRNVKWSIEVKSTANMSYSLRRDVLLQAEGNALADGRRMALVVAFVAKPGGYTRAQRYVVTTEDDFLEREQELERLREYYETRRVI
jgi:hypothetical protein